jgi:hypothetical protein
LGGWAIVLTTIKTNWVPGSAQTGTAFSVRMIHMNDANRKIAILDLMAGA